MATFEDRLERVQWADYHTAYGPAVRVPDQLRRLAGSDEPAALAASHDLWCGLCHQHAYVSTAAVPALPFLLEVLDRAGEQLTVQILDILFGFASCTNPHCEPSPAEWITELRDGVLRERPRFERLAGHANRDVADFAGLILEEMDSPAPPAP